MFEMEQLRQKASRVLRRKWLQYSLRHVTNNDNHAGLDRVYQVRDPWNLDSAREHARFEATNGMITRYFGPVGDLLEIGAGEGLQSSYLSQVCRNLHGVEVSPTAVERARRRVPRARFDSGDLLSQPWLNEGRRFDLVVACEVLYYISDLEATLAAMNRLGDACFVSFFTGEAYKLTARMERIEGVNKEWFCFDGITWLMAWWRNPRAEGGAAGLASAG